MCRIFMKALPVLQKREFGFIDTAGKIFIPPAMTKQAVSRMASHEYGVEIYLPTSIRPENQLIKTPDHSPGTLFLRSAFLFYIKGRDSSLTFGAGNDGSLVLYQLRHQCRAF